MTIRDKWLYIMKDAPTESLRERISYLRRICYKNELLTKLYNSSWEFNWTNDDYYECTKPTKEFVLLVNLVYKMKKNDNA